MPKRRTLTQESFETLLMWLAPDREQAAEKYENIRHSLIKIFTWRGLNDAEGLADETINRVAAKVQGIRATYSGEPALYFYGVAKKIIHEYYRTVQQLVPLMEELSTTPLLTGELEDKSDISDREYECLKACLEKLSPENREFILSYYSKVKQAKIDHRKELAKQLGIGVNHLRVRAHRIRATLEKCIIDCLEERYKDEGLD